MLSRSPGNSQALSPSHLRSLKPSHLRSFPVTCTHSFSLTRALSPSSLSVKYTLSFARARALSLYLSNTLSEALSQCALSPSHVRQALSFRHLRSLSPSRKQSLYLTCPLYYLCQIHSLLLTRALSLSLLRASHSLPLTCMRALSFFPSSTLYHPFIISLSHSHRHIPARSRSARVATVGVECE